jgi:hypothetical protein
VGDGFFEGFRVFFAAMGRIHPEQVSHHGAIPPTAHRAR